MSDFPSDSEDFDAESLRRLKEENEELRKKNISFESQHQRLLDLVSQTEEVTKENAKAKAKIREMQMELSDAQNKLENSTRQIDELQKSLQEEKRSSQTAKSEVHANCGQEIEKISRDCQQKIDVLQEVIRKQRLQQNSDEITKKLVDAKFNRLINAAQWHFSAQIGSIEQLIKLLEDSDQKQKEENVAPMVPPNESDEKMLKVVNLAKKYKAKAKLARQVFNDQENELDELRRQMQEMKEKAQKKIQMLEAENQKQTEENKALSETAKNDQIKYAEKIQALKNELSQQKIECVQQRSASQNTSTNSVTVVPSTKVMPATSTKVISLELEKESLSKSVQELKSQIQLLSTSKEEATKKMGEINSINAELIIQSEKQKNEINSLKTIHEESMKEIETLRTSLHYKQQQQTQTNVKKEKPLITESQLNELNSKMNQQTKEITDLLMQINSKEDELAQKRLEITTMQEQMKMLDKKAEQTFLDLQDAKCRLSKKESSSIDEFLPSEAWRPIDYEPSLASKIDAIGRNKTLQPLSRLQNIYKIIQKYYGEQIRELNNLYNQAINQAETIKDVANRFIVDSSIALYDHAITFDSIIKPEVSAKFIEAISSIRAENDKIQHENNRILDLFSSLHENLGIEGEICPESVIQYIKKDKETLHSMEENLRRSKNRRKALKRELLSVSNQMQTATRSVEEIQTQSAEKIAELESMYQKAKQELTENKAKVSSLTNELTFMKESLEEKTEKTEYLEEQIKENTIREAKERDLIISQEFSSLSERVDQLTSELEATNAKLQSQQNLRLAAENEVDRLNNEISQAHLLEQEAKEAIDKRIALEKENMSKFYESTLQQLKKQCDAHREDIKKLSEDNAKVANQLLNEKALNSKARAENRKLESELRISNEQLEREKKLCEVTIRSRLISAETKYNSKLDEHYAAAESDKRRIFSFAASAFKQFFVASTQLDERSYRALIDSASGELQRLSSSDSTIRTMLNASESQTTEDAVAQSNFNIM